MNCSDYIEPSQWQEIVRFPDSKSRFPESGRQIAGGRQCTTAQLQEAGVTSYQEAGVTSYQEAEGRRYQEAGGGRILRPGEAVNFCWHMNVERNSFRFLCLTISGNTE